MSDSTSSFDQLVEQALGIEVQAERALSSGTTDYIFLYRTTDGEKIVAKFDLSTSPLLTIEGEMLRYLRVHAPLPVPDVLFAGPQLLVTRFIPGDSRLGPSEQAHAAELLAALHQITADQFGLQYPDGRPFDTLIGGLPQPNPPTESWLEFFRDRRLMYMAGEAALVGQLPIDMLLRLDKLAAKLDQLINEPAAPALIHGDMWTGNILAGQGRITAFLDPAIYFADPEIELAFSTLFGTFRESFFERYQDIRPLAPDFFEIRRDIYNLYPLLVHTRLFGGAYVQGIGRTLKRFGF